MLFSEFQNIVQAGEFELNLYKNNEFIDNWPKQHWKLKKDNHEIIIISDHDEGPFIDLSETDYTYILDTKKPTLVVVATKEGKTFEIRYEFS